MSAVSLKDTYLNILALFLGGDKIEARFVKCLIKWGLQLNITQQDIDATGNTIDQLQFSQLDKITRLESVYHLVQMIYLDNVVEDTELEVASIYAEKLGFGREVVGDLFKSIATRAYDGSPDLNIRREVIDFLKLSQA